MGPAGVWVWQSCPEVGRGWRGQQLWVMLWAGGVGTRTPWAGAGPGLWWWLPAISSMSGAQAVVLVSPCLLLPSSQGFFTVIASELLFSF